MSAAAPFDPDVQERVILVDPCPAAGETLGNRLTSLGFLVEIATDGVEGAALALSNPPSAVIADLWMPGVSGIQLCRLLRCEVATIDVPVLLRGDEHDRRNRFWAERAGAFAFLGRGRIGELVRVLQRAIASAPPRDDFFMQFAGAVDIRDRIARHLDAALFESVVASEVRALGSCDSLQRLFDLLCQFVSQVHPYRWLALDVRGTDFLGVHHHSDAGDDAPDEARMAFDSKCAAPFVLADEDAVACVPQADPFVAAISFGGREVGKVALAPSKSGDSEAGTLVRILSSELGGPLRMVLLVEETQRLAATDALTKLQNRRAFMTWMDTESARLDRYGGEATLGLLDVDHFKAVNDGHGHGAGDQVLVAVARAVESALRRADVVARWGGEEFVFVLPSTSLAASRTAAERVRSAIESTIVDLGPCFAPIRVTASIGLAHRRDRESIECLVARADAAMYRAKQAGRNRVECDADHLPAEAVRFDTSASLQLATPPADAMEVIAAGDR